jgi:hypothetical protein
VDELRAGEKKRVEIGRFYSLQTCIPLTAGIVRSGNLKYLNPEIRNYLSVTIPITGFCSSVSVSKKGAFFTK